jgi:hypothetical protein
MRRGGVTSSKEPLLAPLKPGPRIRYPVPKPEETSFHAHQRAPGGGRVRRVPGRSRYRQAAAAAAQRDAEKRAQYLQDEWDAYRFTPLSVETFGHLGTPMMRLLSDIGNLAVSSGDGLFTKERSFRASSGNSASASARPMPALSMV